VKRREVVLKTVEHPPHSDWDCFWVDVTLDGQTFARVATLRPLHRCARQRSADIICRWLSERDDAAMGLS
jgi:hypothetical protein